MSSPSPTASPKEPEEVDEKIPTPNGEEIQPPPAEEVDNTMEPDGYPDFEVKEQDRWLPIANVARIMKTALPENAKIAKEAKECMQECVSEFISFITSEASEKCQQEKRKTVNGEDILFAMTSLGFENYAEALKVYLGRYRENLSTRGDQQKPLVAGGSVQAGPSTMAQPYDHTNHHLLNNPNPMETAADTSHDYGYGHPVPGEY